MSVISKFHKFLRIILLTFCAIGFYGSTAIACDLQLEKTSFSATIEYDVFAFERAGTSIQLEVTNSGDEDCPARLRLHDQSEQSAPYKFPGLDLNVEATLSSRAAANTSPIQSSPIPLTFPAGTSTIVSIDFFTDQHDLVKAGSYTADLTLVLLADDSEAKLIEIPGELHLSALPRAQINLAGAAGDFGYETYSDGLFFDNPSPGDQQRLFVQTRSNALTTMTIRSQNGGKMVSPDIVGHAVHYDLIFDGKEIDLSSEWSVPDRPETDLKGTSEEMIVRISDDNKKFFAGDYEDIVTIEIITQ